MPEIKQYEVNVYPNCKESVFVTAEFVPPARVPVSCAPKPNCPPPQPDPCASLPAPRITRAPPALPPPPPHVACPPGCVPAPPASVPYDSSSSSRCSPSKQHISNNGSQSNFQFESPRLSGSHHQSTAKSSPTNSRYEVRNGIKYELAPIEYINGNGGCQQRNPYVTQVASRPIFPSQLNSRALSSPPGFHGGCSQAFSAQQFSFPPQQFSQQQFSQAPILPLSAPFGQSAPSFPIQQPLLAPSLPALPAPMPSFAPPPMPMPMPALPPMPTGSCGGGSAANFQFGGFSPVSQVAPPAGCGCGVQQPQHQHPSIPSSFVGKIKCRKQCCKPRAIKQQLFLGPPIFGSAQSQPRAIAVPCPC